jgi:hypothetical protein
VGNAAKPLIDPAEVAQLALFPVFYRCGMTVVNGDPLPGSARGVKLRLPIEILRG